MATQTPAGAGHPERTEQTEPSAHGERRPNRLAQETSPYLLQHAYNPVDWYPWGPEALEKARREDKPILLSIGYSACHWCHVMERESFEDEETARLMNELYVPIKVDREERPDLDAIYMEAVQALTQHGGWPMTVFLLPDGTPFYGGTYFPATPKYGILVPPAARRGGQRLPRRRETSSREPISYATCCSRRAAAGGKGTRRRAGESPGRPTPRALTRPVGSAGHPSSAKTSEPTPGRPAAHLAPDRQGAIPAHGPADPGQDGPEVRPAWWRLSPLLGGRALARASLREDALRQRPAGQRLPARLFGRRASRSTGASAARPWIMSCGR